MIQQEKLDQHLWAEMPTVITTTLPQLKIVTYTTMKSCVKPEAMNYSFANGLQAYQAKGNEPW
jgi:hypothetical protein